MGWMTPVVWSSRSGVIWAVQMSRSGKLATSGQGPFFPAQNWFLVIILI